MMPLIKSRPTRKGVAVAALVLVLAMVNLVVIGVIAAGADESEDALSRVESLRAFYASESGSRVALRCLNSGLPPPTAGATLTLGSAKVRYVQVPASAGSGIIIIEGTSGASVRRSRVTVDLK